MPKKHAVSWRVCVEELKAFNSDGYYFDADSSLKGELVFKRDE